MDTLPSNAADFPAVTRGIASAALVLLAGLGVCGCDPQDQLKPTPDGVTQQPKKDLGPVSPAPVTSSIPKRYIPVIRLRIWSIEVPVGMVSESEEIWSYLNEEAIGADDTVPLARNGMRVGLGHHDAWVDVEKTLKRMTARKIRSDVFTSLPWKSAVITLNARQGPQLIFTYRKDGTLSGSDYPPGDNLLAVVCTLDEDDPTRILVAAAPQICASRRKPKIVKDDETFLITAAPTTYSFPELAFRAQIVSGGFILMGPSAAARNPYTVGNRFLIRRTEGIESELVLVIMPDVLAELLDKPSFLP